MKPRRTLLFTLTALLALCASCGVWLHRERQQYTLNRQLIAALKHRDATKAVVLVNEGADPNTRYDPRETPSLKVLLLHLLHRAPLPDYTSPTAFMMVCAGWTSPSENLPLLEAMLAQDADVNTRADTKHTALHDAVRREKLPIVQLLLQHGANPNAQDKWGQTPLMWATQKGNVPIARLLLRYGAAPNVQDGSGQTPLQWAVVLPASRSLIPDLLARGANPNLRSRYRVTALSAAQNLARPDLVRLLQQHGAK